MDVHVCAGLHTTCSWKVLEFGLARWKPPTSFELFSVLCWRLHTQPLNGHFSRTTGWAGTRKVKPIWILLKQDSEWQWHQLGHMQVCTSLQTDNHAMLLSCLWLTSSLHKLCLASNYWRLCDVVLETMWRQCRAGFLLTITLSSLL